MVQLVIDFENLFDTTNIISKSATFSERRKEEWTEQEIKDFLESRTKLVIKYYTILAKKGDWLYADELLNELMKEMNKKYEPQAIAGIRAGNTKLYNKMNKESLDESIRDERGIKYRIKPKYVNYIKKFLLR